jgi:hypothetical protein
MNQRLCALSLKRKMQVGLRELALLARVLAAKHSEPQLTDEPRYEIRYCYPFVLPKAGVLASSLPNTLTRLNFVFYCPRFSKNSH